MDGADGVDNQTSVGVLVSQCLCHWSQLAMTCVTSHWHFGQKFGRIWQQ